MDVEYEINRVLGVPPRKQWVVQKFPVKGGTVIRSAMQIDLFFRPVTWATVEGKVES